MNINVDGMRIDTYIRTLNSSQLLLLKNRVEAELENKGRFVDKKTIRSETDGRIKDIFEEKIASNGLTDEKEINHIMYDKIGNHIEALCDFTLENVDIFKKPRHKDVITLRTLGDVPVEAADDWKSVFNDILDVLEKHSQKNQSA